MSTKALTLEDVRAEAKQKLKGICMVYKDCDGGPTRFCQGQHYGRPLRIGGIGSGASFHNNWLALSKLTLKMDTVGPHVTPDTRFTLFGRELSMPVMGAPISGVNSFGGESVITEREFCRAVVSGCRDAGTLGWRGDTYTYSLENSYGIDAIAEADGAGIKIVKPRAQADIIRFFEKAEQCGAVAVGMDVDGCGSYMMSTHNQPVFRKTPEDIRELVSATSLPVIIKGIMHADDAVDAVEAGASAVVVSNHGGRVLDHTPGTADVLPSVVQALAGSNAVIMVDGGVRTGYDVLKMLAIGAHAVLVGRDVLRAAVGAGAEGVRLHMEYLQKTLAKAMLMTGSVSLDAIPPGILMRREVPESATE